MNKHWLKLFVLVVLVTLVLGIAPAAISPVAAASPDIVISQVYGGGGNSGAPYTHDFVELFNRGTTPISLTGWSIQYTSATGTGNFGASSTQLTELPNVSLAPGQYYLIQQAAGAGSGVSLPMPDLIDPTPIAMSASAGKVALATGTTSLGCNGGSTPCDAAQLARIKDLVGYGSANFFEGAGAAPTLSNTTAALRAANGCTDTDNNGSDFTAGSPAPRNTSSPLNPCPAASPLINEFVFNHTGTDTHEFVEIFGSPNTDYSTYAILQIEGDGTGAGVVDSVQTVGTTDAQGYWTTGFLSNAFENGTVTLFLVKGFSGAIGNDLDTNNDGIFDTTPWDEVVDDVAVSDGGAGDLTYSTTDLGPTFSGGNFSPGGASRIPNGVDTNSDSDWTLNDFEGAGLPGFTGGPDIGEALNTPGALNELVTQTDTAPDVSSTNPNDGMTDVATDTNITITFTEAVNVTGDWFDISCSISVAVTGTVSGGPTSFTIDPDTNFVDGDDCTVTIFSANVSDQDTDDPPDNMVADFMFSFSVTNPGVACETGFTPIYEIQGSGLVTPLTGQVVTTQGVVVGDFEGSSPALRGFYLQDLSGDGNQATSDGLFVFNGNNDVVAVGDVVRVTGTANEFQDQTQISSVTSLIQCGDGDVAPVDITFPLPSTTYLEQYEGMLVRLPQTMVVTEHFQLGRFGQVLMSPNQRLAQPTNVVLPGAPAIALQEANNLNKILVDDNLNNQNPDPILFGRGGLPLSASNTLRGGDSVTNLVGVMTYTWAGNVASGNAYRIRPVNALDGGVPDFQAANPRPEPAPTMAGTLRVTGFNVLNYFNTFSGCTNGVGGAPTNCRGAESLAEFERQWVKTVAAIVESNADVIGLSEIENDGYGSDSAIQDLVDRLNAATSAGNYAFINADANTGQVNALGTDAIKVGFIYRPGAVTPVGTTAALNSDEFVTGGDSGPRNRPALAQAFEENATGGRFVAVANHLKSKGSACDAPDALDGQGNCNQVRVNAVQLILEWLALDPTGIADPDVLILGDLNSYAMEDPITLLKDAGYTNLIYDYNGDSAYSYAFDGQWGYLDHALATPTMTGQVLNVVEWHINADEPNVLDYNTNFKSPGQVASLFAPDKFRSSDHDPVLVDTTLNGSPICSDAFPSLDILWAPNHEMMPIQVLGVVDPENDPVSITITSIYQDEPVNGTGDGNTAPDGMGIGTDTAYVRAERDGNGNGRVYHIAFMAADATGSCTGTVTVSVPLSRNRAPAIDDGPLYDSTLLP
jgi:predicted extracellular nuclease